MLSAETLKRLEDLITIEDVKEIFDIQTDATIHRWRNETDFGELEIRIPGRGRDIIRFELDDLTKWAKDHNRLMPGLERWTRIHRAE